MKKKATGSNPGESNGNAKLNDEKVKAILRSKGQITSRELGDIYDIAHSTVARIWKGDIWKHITLN